MKFNQLSLIVLFSMTLGAISLQAQANDTLSDAAQSAADSAAKIAEDAQNTFSKGLREGKIESLMFFNSHLRGFDIDAEVQGQRVILTGVVSKSIERDYAEQLALSVDGVANVTNKIKVDGKHAKSAQSGTTDRLANTVKDATITANIKTKLLANKHISGMNINVDTADQEVTLQGVAQSSIEKDLIERIADNTAGVKKVKNRISVSSLD